MFGTRRCGSDVGSCKSCCSTNQESLYINFDDDKVKRAASRIYVLLLRSKNFQNSALESCRIVKLTHRSKRLVNFQSLVGIISRKKSVTASEQASKREREMRLRMGFARASPLASILRLTFFQPNQWRQESVFPPLFLRRRISCSVVSCSPKLQTPLYLRPAAFRATVSELKKWHLWAETLASSVGSTFLDLDNGPDSTLLLRELNWLLEDALENPKALSSNTDNYGDATPVSLRACLDDLYSMWKQRVEDRRPFQYVVGCEHWRDLVLGVQEGVLIPRPETELIVDLVNDVLKEDEHLREGLWTDLGTGSGALAIGISRILGPSGMVVAIDLSPVAVAVASANVQRYNLQDRVKVKQGSWFEPLKDEGRELAGLVSNPPYIPSEHISGLQAEVAKHEPKLALDGGSNGLDDLLHLCKGAASVLKPGGFFAFETNGEEQSKFLAGYMETESKGVFSNVKIISDFGGVQRFVTGFKAR